MKQRAVVTGGAGFIGGYVVRELLREGYSVTVIDNLSKGKKSSTPEEVEFVYGDICDYETILSVINEGDLIFHLAALTSVTESLLTPLPYHTTNIMGTYNVLEAARVKNARGVIFSSSAAIYGSQEGLLSEDAKPHPESPYATQKLIGETLCQSYAIQYTLPSIALRYFNVYGEGNHEEGSYAPVTARFLKAKREGNHLSVVGDGEQTRDFIHVKNIAEVNVAAIKLLTPKYFEIINVATGIGTKVIDIAHLVGGDIDYLPARIEPQHSLGKNDKLHKLFPQQSFISLEEGLEEMLGI
jgi:UDP-glucose 4-epimerase